jgi:hypothetical protein
MKKSFLRLFLFLIIIYSCSKKDTAPASKEFKISGKVVDTLGLGLSNIQIFYQKDSFIVTDANGFWYKNITLGSTVIQPKDTNYIFSPSSVKVINSDTNIVFTARPVSQRDINALHVYNWFTHMQLSNGLLESTENSNIISLYDNALAALVFIAKSDYTRAELVFNFFNSRLNSELLTGTGGFFQFRDKNGVPNGNRWLGDNAWLLIALNNYQAKTNNYQYQNLITALSNWIQQQQDTDGGVWGGFDNSSVRIGKVTEGMIDAFNAVSGYTNFHQNLLNYLKLNRWNSNEKLLMSWPGNKYVYALDNHSWGYCAFEDFPYSVLQKAAIFLNTQTATVYNTSITGYCFDIDKDNVWLEGTGQMVVALQKANQINIAAYYLSEMEKVIITSNSFSSSLGMPYSSNNGTHYGTSALWVGADTKPCISSSAWYLFGCLNFDPMAISYLKTIPINNKFWLN